MSIANELCSEVATAVLARQEDKGHIDAEGMTRILMEVHATLRRLTADGRHKLLRSSDTAHQSFRISSAASHNH